MSHTILQSNKLGKSLRAAGAGKNAKHDLGKSELGTRAASVTRHVSDE